MPIYQAPWCHPRRKQSYCALSLVQEPQISLTNIFAYLLVLCMLGVIQDHLMLGRTSFRNLVSDVHEHLTLPRHNVEGDVSLCAVYFNSTCGADCYGN